MNGTAQAFGYGPLTINPTGTSGNIALDAATVTSTGAIFFNAPVTVNTNSATAVGTLNFNDSTPVIGSLTGNGNVVLNKSTGTTLTIGNANTNTAFSGVISQEDSDRGYHQGWFRYVNPHWLEHLHRGHDRQRGHPPDDCGGGYALRDRFGCSQ